MAKKKSKEELDVDNLENDELDEDEKKGGKIPAILIATFIIAIWLVIFGLLIKMDVGGFGSTVLRPLLKNVPIINQILPAASDQEVAVESGTKYKNLTEALAKIKELEQELNTYENSSTNSADKIAELTAEVSRLKTFEDSQANFEALKKKFDDEVVFNAKAPDITQYKTWYESIDSANAATIYQQVLEKINYTQQVKDWAEAYSKMEPKNAAAILQEMTGDMNLVSAILLNMKTPQRALILAQMDTVFAAKITKIMYPE
ncbi:MotE family protein [[Clostridium] fimetarium]|uniref:Flagellar motility protein MotE, a chaperone for MotC folding n=1 Tax=[Clostridium] fimetarium TaxID=99656 RepID=A0A1I0N1N2_9FIRM|nr:hypothetical protein [[Clostridium] fimetarium]SEV94725.1 hypothetical protein SAMN05421659_102306 [[Clostridium] fimetarium]